MVENRVVDFSFGGVNNTMQEMSRVNLNSNKIFGHEYEKKYIQSRKDHRVLD